MPVSAALAEASVADVIPGQGVCSNRETFTAGQLDPAQRHRGSDRKEGVGAYRR